MNLDFAPDAERGRALDARMHHELGLSLRHVCEACRGKIAFDQAGMEAAVRHLQTGGRVLPSIFARYYELVEAIVDEDVGAASQLFLEIAAMQPAPDKLQVVTLGSEAISSETRRYVQMMNSDPSIDIGFQPPTAEVAVAFRDRLDGGLALLDQVLPELAAEIRAILRQIVIAGSDPSKAMQFDGGSHYQLWGALFLNGNFHPDEIAVAEVLAHESAHSLLFGFCTDEALVENDEAELFSSPLRVDLRPMDGIYHATFVSARMHWAMSRLARSGLLTSDQRERARQAAFLDARNFEAGHKVVMQHGKLTALGWGLMDSARRYMDGTS